MTSQQSRDRSTDRQDGRQAMAAAGSIGFTGIDQLLFDIQRKLGSQGDRLQSMEQKIVALEERTLGKSDREHMRDQLKSSMLLMLEALSSTPEKDDVESGNPTSSKNRRIPLAHSAFVDVFKEINEETIKHISSQMTQGFVSVKEEMKRRFEDEERHILGETKLIKHQLLKSIAGLEAKINDMVDADRGNNDNRDDVFWSPNHVTKMDVLSFISETIEAAKNETMRNTRTQLVLMKDEINQLTATREARLTEYLNQLKENVHSELETTKVELKFDLERSISREIKEHNRHNKDVLRHIESMSKEIESLRKHLATSDTLKEESPQAGVSQGQTNDQQPTTNDELNTLLVTKTKTRHHRSRSERRKNNETTHRQNNITSPTTSAPITTTTTNSDKDSITNNNPDAGVCQQLMSKLEENIRSEIQSSGKQIVNKIHTDLDRQLQHHARDLTDLVDKEFQLSRDMARTTTAGRKNTYSFVFRVREFNSRVKSGIIVYSCPWYVHQLDTCIKGWVYFLPDGQLRISIGHGRYPATVGLAPRDKKSFKFKVCVFEEVEGKDVKVVKDSTGWSFDETSQKVYNATWGHHVGDVSCQSLVDEGYVRDGVLLVRYKIMF